MLRKAFRQHSEENRLPGLVLIFALVFAAAHVALHDLDVNGSGLDGHDQCQVCRLNHMPAASPPPSLLLLAPLLILAFVVLIPSAERHLSTLPHAQRARAPPLF